MGTNGENVSTDWTLVQAGTRYSVEFAAFLKRIAWIDTRLRLARLINTSISMQTS